VSTKIVQKNRSAPDASTDGDRVNMATIVKKAKSFVTFLETDNEALILYPKNVFYSQWLSIWTRFVENGKKIAASGFP
jgi:hypothetical protein